MRKPTFAYAKTKVQISFAVTAKLISAFVFATQIVPFLNQKIPSSSHLLCLYSSVCVGPILKPYCLFSHEAAHFLVLHKPMFWVLIRMTSTWVFMKKLSKLSFNYQQGSSNTQF